MSKKETLELKIKDADKAYQEGCPDLKNALRRLYPDHKFEKEITLRGGQVWESDCSKIMLISINADTERRTWILFFMNFQDSEHDIRNTYAVIDFLSSNHYRLCPNAIIRVEND